MRPARGHGGACPGPALRTPHEGGDGPVQPGLRVGPGRSEGPSQDAVGSAPSAPRASSGTAALAGSVAPRGGIFDARAARVTSRVLPHGAGTAAAEVRREPSRPDGRACLVLDHSRASLVARGVRDGLRLLRSGLHLGRAYREGLRVADLTLGA